MKLQKIAKILESTIKIITQENIWHYAISSDYSDTGSLPFYSVQAGSHYKPNAFRV